MKTCFKIESLPYPLTLEQYPNGDFKITYGQEITENLDYASATLVFGQCFFHALSCAGKLDNGYGE